VTCGAGVKQAAGRIRPAGRQLAIAGLRHELSSLAQILGPWVRIPLEALMSVCVYSVSVLSRAQVAALRRADPRPRNHTYCVEIEETEKAAEAQQRAVEP
jgi:hypothetical protein